MGQHFDIENMTGWKCIELAGMIVGALGLGIGTCMLATLYLPTVLAGLVVLVVLTLLGAGYIRLLTGG